MGKKRPRNPSGFPSRRIPVPQVPIRQDFDDKAVHEHTSFVGIRRSLLIASVAVGVLAAATAIAGNTDFAQVVLYFALLPLLVILLGAHLFAVVTK